MKTKKYYEVTMVFDDTDECRARFTPINDSDEGFTHKIPYAGFFNLGEIWKKKITKHGTKLTLLSSEEAEKVKQQFKKKPIFITEDGVEIFGKQAYVFVAANMRILSAVAFDEMELPEEHKRFSTRQAAEIYIAEQKAKNKKLTYEDVAKELFNNKVANYIESSGLVNNSKCTGSSITDPNNSTTSAQLEKLLAINKMMNVAVYLNPKKEEADWSIFIDRKGLIEVDNGFLNFGQTLFTSKESAQQAIEILGEDVVRLALS